VPYKWNTTTGVRIAIDSGPVKITNPVDDPNANWDNQVGDVVFDNQDGVDVIELVRSYYNSLGTNLVITNVGMTAVPIIGKADVGQGIVATFSQFVNFTSSGIQPQSNSSDCKIGNQVSGANLAVFFDAKGLFFSTIGLGAGVLGIASPSLYDNQGNITC